MVNAAFKAAYFETQDYSQGVTQSQEGPGKYYFFIF